MYIAGTREMENISRGPTFGDFVTFRTEGSMQDLSFASTEYTELQPLLSGIHSVMRVKLALAGGGWGVHAHPLSLHLPSPVKLQCTLQLSGQTH